jgi:hypothetical protein
MVFYLKTKESYEYVSIAEAARSFDTHPKTIWRVVYNNKLYLNRYQITEKNISNGSKVIYNLPKFYEDIYKLLYFLVNKIKSNKIFLYRVLFFILVATFVCICSLYIIILSKDIYRIYIDNLSVGKGNYNRCVLEHKLLLNNVLNNTNTGLITNKTSFIDIKELRHEYLFNKTWVSVHNTSSQLGIYQSIINQINLDFSSKGTETFSAINTPYSSPIIERVNINNIFSNAIASTNISNDTTNSLGVHGVNHFNNRNFVIVDNVLINTKLKTTELLNYQSNILYCLINGLSPSIY